MNCIEKFKLPYKVQWHVQILIKQHTLSYTGFWKCILYEKKKIEDNISCINLGSLVFV